MALDVIATKQIEYQASMLQYLAEEKASDLIDFAEKNLGVKGAEIVTFYRMGASEVGGETLNMFADAYTGNGGKTDKFEAKIAYVYTSDKIKASDINSTALDLESSFIKSLGDALRRNCDKIVLDAVAAKTADLTKMGDGLKTIDDPDNIKDLIEATALSYEMVDKRSVSEGRAGVALVLDVSQYSKLHRAEMTINANYPRVNELIGKDMLFGCDVVTVAKVCKDPKKMYIIPAGTFGVGSWENDLIAEAWWEKGQDSLFCMAKRSLGVVVIEPASIIEFSHS